MRRSNRLTTSEPNRRGLREEAEEWDHLSDEDLARLFDEGEPVYIRLRRTLPPTLKVARDAIENKFWKG